MLHVLIFRLIASTTFLFSMNRLDFPYRLGAVFLLLATCESFGNVSLPAIFSDHMVLQKSGQVPVWGWAGSSETVRVTVAGARGETKADANGQWRLDLNLDAAAAGPHQMVVEGENRLEINDVLIGEVWVCSGQSNMAQQMGRLQTPRAAEDIAHSANPRLRQFRAATNLQQVPSGQCKGAWEAAGPETTKSFSAVAYYFGREIQHRLQGPVGLVSISIGGTPAEGWTSLEALQSDPDLSKTAVDLVARYRDFPQAQKTFAAAYRQWEAKYDRQDKPAADPALFAAPGISMDDWQSVSLSGTRSTPIPCGGGAIWLRKTITTAGGKADESRSLELGIPSEFQTVYWNGERIAGKALDEYPGLGSRESCPIPANRVKLGENVLAVRLFNPTGAPAIAETHRWLRMGSVSLAGEWQAKAEYLLPALDAKALEAYPQAPKALPVTRRIPSFLFNGMVHPLIPYAMRGVIWYQGEDNVPRAAQYRKAFPLLINDWRARWGRGDFPFYFCQLACFRPKTNQPGDSNWAELREAQSMALALPNTGQAVLIDLGEEEQVHYVRKEVAGQRLAAAALAKTYRQKNSHTGPEYDSMSTDGQAIRIRFKPSQARLEARPLPADYLLSTIPPRTKPLVRNSPQSPLEGFAICGEDRRWVWANARIDGESVVVESSEVPHPVAVRYGWANNPTCNLYNSDGFPAAPFRTDRFPGITETAAGE